MANPIIKILRGHTAPPTLEAGRIAIDQTNKNLYVGIDDGNGGTINEIVGGSGTFATKQFVTDAVSAGTGSLGTMSTQNADSVAITGGAIDGTAIGATTPSTGRFTDIEFINATLDGSLLLSPLSEINMNEGRILGLPTPVDATEAVRKTDLDSAISALGSVFHYIGDVSAATGNDLDTLSDTTTGAYYRVDSDGTYTASGGFSAAAKVGDAFVKTSTGWQKLDNVDAVVIGTANEISVSGDENAGYTVAIDPVFSGRLTTAEGDIVALEGRATDLETKTQNIDLAGTVAGTTVLNGSLSVSGSITDATIDGGVY